ncbi:Uncharacterised protein [Actinomyces slackii]|uniref:Gram-positive cocci surface proteins LPxTG domain-containing protein n=3 Tax=Actinomyces slackii TaxID=52774 RepID=A0A3S4SSD2_9ACTO|nr:Uncharacterised protein [Actinomyces slackii]
MRGLPAFITGRAHRGRDRSGGSRRRGALLVAALLVVAVLIPAGRPPATAQDWVGLNLRVVYLATGDTNEISATAFVGSNPTSTFAYECYESGKEDEGPFAEGKVTVKNREETRLDFPSRSDVNDYCRFRIVDEKDVHVPGFTFEYMEPPIATKYLTSDPSIISRLYLWYDVVWGDFTVSKVVSGDDLESVRDKTYRVGYSCTTDGGAVMDGVVEVKAGESVKTTVVESDCVITEEDASVQGAALTTSYSVNGGASTSEPPTVRATRGDGGNPTVTVNNHYAELRGDFAVVKTVTGADAGDREFVFTYTCTDPDETSGSMRVRADGQPVNAGFSLPKDTTCTIVEQREGTEIEGYTLSELGQATVTITAGATARAEIENTYTPVPAPEPSPEPTATATTEAPSPEPSPTATQAPSPEPNPEPTATATTEAPSPEPSPEPTATATTEAPSPEPNPSATTQAPNPEPIPSATTQAPAPAPSPSADGNATAPSSAPAPAGSASAGAPSAGSGSAKDRPALARTGTSPVVPALLGSGTVLVGLALLRAHSRRRN